VGGERPGALLARRAPKMKQWSLDARSKGQPWPLPERYKESENPRSEQGAFRRARVGRVRSLNFLSILQGAVLFF